MERMFPSAGRRCRKKVPAKAAVRHAYDLLGIDQPVPTMNRLDLVTVHVLHSWVRTLYKEGRIDLHD